MVFNYKKTEDCIWTGRANEKDTPQYLYEKVEIIHIDKFLSPTSTQKKACLVGFCCDEGVKRNLGRIGAKEAPDSIRKSLAKYPNHLKPSSSLIDIGNFFCDDDHLEYFQEAFSKIVTKLISNNMFPIILGGGHELAYAHGLGLLRSSKNKKLGIINIDAHLDLRSYKNGASSGTPFLQLAHKFEEEEIPFHYLCIGAQRQSNTKELMETAQKLNVQMIDYPKCKSLETIKKSVSHFTEPLDSIYLTIDLDAIGSSFAPGVSAPSPLGFTPHEVFAILHEIMATQKVVSVDIVENNPKFDIDNRTSKLAASIIEQLLYQWDTA